MQRIIGQYGSGKNKPMLLAIGGLHGNEPSGEKAIVELLQLLDNELDKNKEFKFNGHFIGLRGNLKAIEKKVRFLKKDLNRQWTKENVERVLASPTAILDAEDMELKELLNSIKSIIATNQPSKILLLDLHTTTAEGGVFVIVTDDTESIEAAKAIPAPIIKGLLRGLDGTTLHYFTSENIGVSSAAICFEAGQHDDPLSVNRAVAALVNALKAVGCIDEQDIEPHHSTILKEHTKDLPLLSELLYCHKIKENDAFEMKKGYQNFQEIEKDEILATDKNGIIKAPYDCRILMPLYQKQGNDGFFLIKSLDS
jgi:succinylglutamate desuccinylase